MGKIAIVTGGNRGLGRDAVVRIAEDGTDLIFTYRTHPEEAQEVVAVVEKLGRVAVALRLDAGDIGSFEGFAEQVRGVLKERWGREDFDFLVNNAGLSAPASFMETTEEAFDLLMGVHFKGVYFLTQKLVPNLADGGRIINISTGLTRFTGPGGAAYASMKGAVEVLTRYLAKELGPRGISVNTVAPGPVATDFGGGRIRDNEELKAMLGSQTALGRVGQPEDIGGVIAALLSPNTGWVTGQRVEASGGTFL
ncbi:short-chain dehydrogenase [Acrocarpospora corrugata]|uniref:Short-chain dehydrogenase n=1 Tax=Acrocarpospora corrugata TaxID=35763 RepID=A0A5M3WDS7_9ACTN|nr:SDR family oxidoreductase [Acrocarpospora corrugata]GES05231.1 short-chain dehydrogenase [Acrocarpospora corrugata]